MVVEERIEVGKLEGENYFMCFFFKGFEVVSFVWLRDFYRNFEFYS